MVKINAPGPKRARRNGVRECRGRCGVASGGNKGLTLEAAFVAMKVECYTQKAGGGGGRTWKEREDAFKGISERLLRAQCQAQPNKAIIRFTAHVPDMSLCVPPRLSLSVRLCSPVIPFRRPDVRAAAPDDHLQGRVTIASS